MWRGGQKEFARTMLLLIFASALLTGDVQAGLTNYTEGMTEEEVYKFIFDDADVDHILLYDRVLDFYLKCFFWTGPCTRLGGAIREKIPEVFSTVCGKCTQKQKDIWKYCLKTFIPKRPADWEHILQIYDPDGSYWPNIKKFMESD